jgi:hypothetical protein
MRQSVPEDSNLQQHCCEHVRSRSGRCIVRRARQKRDVDVGYCMVCPEDGVSSSIWYVVFTCHSCQQHVPEDKRVMWLLPKSSLLRSKWFGIVHVCFLAVKRLRCPYPRRRRIRGMEVSLQSYLSSVLHGCRPSGLFLPGKEPCCVLNRRLGVSQSLSRQVGEEKHVLSRSGFEIRTVHFVA